MSGFFSLPRSFTRDPLWVDLSPKIKDVFLTILDRVCYEPQGFDDHGVIIDLLPGDICTTIREILNWSSKHMSKNDIERSLVKLKVCGFLRQEVRHIKTVISISDSRVYALIVKKRKTESETTLRQDRDKIETQSNKANKANKAKTKEKVEKEISQKEKIAFREFVTLSQEEHAAMLAAHGEKFLNDMLDILDSYKGSSGKSYKSDFHAMKKGGWVFEKASSSTQQSKSDLQLSKIQNGFKHGQIYKGSTCTYEYTIDSIGVGFINQQTSHVYSVNHKESAFKEKFNSLLYKLGIKNENA